MKKSCILILLVLLVTACTPRSAQMAGISADDPVAVRMLLAEMPKGADLHTHLSGIPYAEDYIKWAAADGSCIESKTGRIVPGPCSGATLDADSFYTKTDLWNEEVNTLSVRQSIKDNRMWGHDQFFATFGKFGEANDDKARMLAYAARQAYRDRAQYLEVMISLYNSIWVLDWAGKVGWNGDPEATLTRLKNAGLFANMQPVQSRIDALDSKWKQLVQDSPARDVTIRYINQIFRGAEPKYVFVQMAWSFELAHRDSRVVGLNMVGPEDAPIAVRDYELHMDMLDFFHRKYPDVPIALHAGELTGGLTTPEALSNHIRLAVTKGHARRIGHGVDIAYEENARDTLKIMKEQGVALEVLLTSNEEILQVSGKDHPLRTYIAAGVPVALASDDMGVGRSTLTNEYVRAVMDQKLGYRELKTAARNSLEYSFLPGRSLWTDAKSFRMVPVCAGSDMPNEECAALLESSEKAAQQWKLEKRFREFEASR